MISTKGRYAVRILVDLAENGEGTKRAIPLKDIAQRQEISEKYLQRIAKALVKAGMIVGTSGKGGGYRLARPAADMPISEVLEAAEGTLAPVACLAPGAAPCERADQCKTLAMWERYDALSHSFFGSVTVRDVSEGSFSV